MLERLLEALAILFVTVAPVNNAVFFSSMTKGSSPRERRSMALRANMVALGILLLFAVGGARLLGHLGIQLSSLQISGGMLLFLIAIRMVLSQPLGSRGEASRQEGDLAIFPFATPMLAGPSSIIAVMVMMGGSGGLVDQAVLLAVLVVFMVFSTFMFLIAGKLARFLGEQGNEVVIRLLGVLLAALSVEMVMDGLLKSALFGQPQS